MRPKKATADLKREIWKEKQSGEEKKIACHDIEIL